MTTDIKEKSKNVQKRNMNLGIKITIIITILIVLVSSVSSLVIFDLSYKALKEEIRDNLIVLASHTAVTLDADELAKIKEPKDEGNDIYLKLQKELQKAKNACHGKLRYVYTLNKVNGEYVYILDATPIEDEENHSQIGEEFVAADYTYVEAAFEKEIAEIEPTPDEVYGGIIQTGYAPIKNELGKTVGVLAIDMDVSVLTEKEQSMKKAGIITLILGFILAMLSSLFFARYITAPILALTKGTKSVAEGDLDTIVSINRNDELGELAQSFNIMIHDLKKSREELKNYSITLIHQEKMAGVGQLSAGVAHEINTPLGYVKSNMETLEKYVMKLKGFYELQQKDKSEYQKEAIDNYIKNNKIEYIYNDLEDIMSQSMDGILKIEKIVRSLLGFSRKTETTEFVLYDINKGIKDTLIIAYNEIKHCAEIGQNLEDVPHIMAIDGDINQVLLNIIINAIYAIKEKGEMGKIAVHTYKKDNFVYCEISDNGVGMEDKNRKRIFEPFFTTKPVGIGTGLGLSITYDIIVNKHNGDISVQSQVGKGTTFIMKLPIQRRTKDE